MLLHELPAEVLLHILASAGSLSDLQALAETSRRIHSIFQLEQSSLVYQVLANELGPVLADALGLSYIQALDALSPTFVEQAESAVSSYAQLLEAGGDVGSHPLLPRRPAWDSVLRLARSFRAMAYMASVYLTSTLRLIERETRQSRDDPEVAFRALARPSATERLRAVRAHYRLQMLLHLWECARADDSRHLSTVNGLCALLFALWEPWELQQVFGLGAFYMRLRPVVGRHPFQDQMVRRDVTGREGFYCFDAFRTHIRFLRLTNEPVWQATVAAMSNPPPGLEATGQAEEGRLAWFRFKLYDCYGAALHAPPPPEPPLSLRFTPGQEHVDNVPFAWVDAFDGRYGNNFWRLDGAPIREKGVSAVGIWSLLGMVMWDAPRAEALKEVSVALSSHCAKGWALLGTRNEHYY